ncbi:acyl-CoA dehydrogenase family protein [Dactylosporangium sp. CA-092794]|uniref:acyl-CoA dehydrogenase family protein n=1 Tax=Dactylosporangium sp. CA-092794 TaxID=3239929 RepID=UPI003D8D5468
MPATNAGAKPALTARGPGLGFVPPPASLSAAARRARAVAAEIGPRAHDGPREWPREALRALGAAKLLAAALPAEAGGPGESIESFVQITEELTAVRTVLGFHMESSSLITALLGTFGDPSLAAEYVPRVLAGEIASTHATTEPAGGSSMSAMRTQAERDGSDWLITGRKAMAALGQVATLVLVTARTPRGPSVFVLPADSPGVSVGPRYPHAGLAELPINPIHFDRVRVPARALVGEEGRGGAVFVGELARTGRPGQAALFVGLARAALECGYRFAARGRLGDRTVKPDGRDTTLARLDRDLESARALTVAAARQADLDGGDSATLLRLASSAKWLASDVARAVCLTVMELQGAWGTLPGRGVTELLADLLDLLPGGGSNDAMAGAIVWSRLNGPTAGR